nr:hypothetical protein [Tanacetum cinerariifolium]
MTRRGMQFSGKRRSEGMDFVYGRSIKPERSGGWSPLLAGLKIARKKKVQTLDVQVDSKLVACQMNGEFVASNEGMEKYLAKAKEQATLFKKFSIKNIPRNQNQKADVLSKLASVSTIVEEEEDNWMNPIRKCLEEGVWLTDENEAITLRMKIGQYVVKDGVLFKKSYLSPMLRCVGSMQANYIIREVHEGACGMHAGARSVVEKIMRKGYYWPTMHGDTKEANDLVERANKSRMHGLKARLGRERVGWVDELPNILWAHQTMLKTSNGETPFSLTYGKRKETATTQEAKYKKKVEQYYNKRVRPMSFKVGDFIYRKNAASRVENQEKLGPNWEGPYRVTEAYYNGSYKLATMNDREVPCT